MACGTAAWIEANQGGPVSPRAATATLVGLAALFSVSAVTEDAMLYWTLLFLVVALIAGVLGFGGVASAATGIARVLFFVFLVMFAVSLMSGSVLSGRGGAV